MQISSRRIVPQWTKAVRSPVFPQLLHMYTQSEHRLLFICYMIITYILQIKIRQVSILYQSRADGMASNEHAVSLSSAIDTEKWFMGNDSLQRLAEAFICSSLRIALNLWFLPTWKYHWTLTLCGLIEMVQKYMKQILKIFMITSNIQNLSFLFLLQNQNFS